MKLTKSLLVFSCSFLFVAFAPLVRSQIATPPAYRAGLLGQNYSGLEGGYVRHRESAPGALRRSGFVASRPMPEADNLDGLFRYNYTSGSPLGSDGQQHDFSIGVARYLRQGALSPFLAGDIGWGWARGGGRRVNSFLYHARLGVEMMLSPDFSLTPAISYSEARQFHDHAWNFGAKLAYRMNDAWTSTFGLTFDDSDNVEFSLGVLRRF